MDGAAALSSRKLVCFRLALQEYALPIESVKETLTLRPLTRVFLTPTWVLGIINLRGDIVPVLDLAQLLGMPAVDVGDSSRIIILDHAGHSAGIVADELAELRDLDDDELLPTPSTLSSEAGEIISGLATVDDGSALRILDLDSLFTSERISSLARTRE